jgi:hypothetical protein
MSTLIYLLLHLADFLPDHLIKVVNEAIFRIFGVVIDKLALRQKHGDASVHPYLLALGFVLQRYCGYLNHIHRSGDVMAESRGTREDKLLENSYAWVFAHGAWVTRDCVRNFL